MNTLILGIDGMDWYLFDKFRANMPFLDSVANEGTFGKLWSDHPMSPPAWTTIFTGMNDKQHRITGFHQAMSDNPYPLLWDIAGEYDLTFGLMTIPMTFSVPMQRLMSGWVVSGHPTPYTATSPEDYVKSLTRRQPRGEGEVNSWRRFRWSWTNFLLLATVKHPVDVGILVVSPLDEIGHGSEKSWAQPEKQNRLKTWYEKVDHRLSEVVESVQPELLIVLSDHGWNSAENCPDTIYANENQIAMAGCGPENFAYHTKEGVFFARGPQVREGMNIGGMHTRDVTPTLLDLWGIRSDHAFDGQVVDITRDLTAAEEAGINEHLRALGYVD